MAKSSTNKCPMNLLEFQQGNPNMGSFMTVRNTYVAILTPHTKRVSNSLGYPFTDYPANMLLGGLVLSYRLSHLAISNIVQDTHLKRFKCSFCSIFFLCLRLCQRPPLWVEISPQWQMFGLQ